MLAVNANDMNNRDVGRSNQYQMHHVAYLHNILSSIFCDDFTSMLCENYDFIQTGHPYILQAYREALIDNANDLAYFRNLRNYDNKKQNEQINRHYLTGYVMSALIYSLPFPSCAPLRLQ